MHFAKSLVLGASFVVAALAQSKFGFTKVPSSVQAGVPTELAWSGGDNSLVTITLQKGDPKNLQTVEIITGQASGNSFTWTPSKSLADGQDYALKISQGLSSVNYSGQFALSGGSGTLQSASVTKSASVSASSSVSSSVSASESASKSESVSKSASASKSESASKSASASITSVATVVSVTASLKLNSTVIETTAIPLNVTTAILLGHHGTAGSSGIPTSHNGTLTRATLTKTTSVSASSSASGSTSASGSASATSSTSGKSTSGKPTSAPNSASNLASPLALVLSAVVAIIYLG